MVSLKILIVEDEPLIAATISTCLEKHGHSVWDECDDVESGVLLLERKTKPDLAFLDVNLEGDRDGVDMAIELDKHNIPYLFLTSQTDPETIEKIKNVNPIGFIVKPFTELGLKSSLDIAWHKYKEDNPDHLITKVDGRITKIVQRDILYLNAYDNYCYVVTADHRYLISRTLKNLAEELDENFFIRCHRSYMVNTQHITSMTSSEVLIKDQRVPLGRSYKDEMMELWKDR